jgi:hypothetical protein
MAVQKRPTAVTVIAVINFVLGGLNLLGVCCTGGFMGLFVMLARAQPAQGQPNPMKDLMDVFVAIPGYVPFLIASTVLGTILAIVLIVAGVGLLRMRGWARMACMVYAVITILATLGNTIYTVAVANPAMQKGMAEWQAKVQKQMQAAKGPGAPAAPPPAAPAGMNNVGGTVGALFGALIGIAYSVVLLVVLNLRDVRLAFARAASGVTETDEEAARGWNRDEPPDILDEGRGRLGDGGGRFQEPPER